ncbi:hypothetical protein BH09ACT8_BH09ACT8_51190 [soil metagenome]|jgi:Protein of unknown function DUF262
MTGILRRYRVNITARPVEFFLDRNPNEPLFDMDQPYQRGVVWGLRRRRNLVKSLLMGVPIPAIVINNRFGAGFSHPDYTEDRSRQDAIVDGKQRVTTLQSFVANQFSVPHQWWDDAAAGSVFFADLTLPQQRGVRNVPMAVAEGHFATLDQERELFDLINFGGVRQGEVDADLPNGDAIRAVGSRPTDARLID